MRYIACSILRAPRIVAASLLLLALANSSFALTYANVTEVTASALKNAVQVTIKADGLLEWYAGGKNQRQESATTYGSSVEINLPGARSALPNFTDISKFPVSYIEMSVPQDAPEGVGLNINIKLFEDAECQTYRSADGQTLIVNVKSPRTLDSIDRNVGPGDSEHKAAFECRCESGLMTINVLKTDMLRVLGEVARVSGLNIAVDDAVGSRIVSLSLEDVPAETVLQSIASAYGLALAKRGDVYMVSEGVPTDIATYRMSGTASFPMKYVRAQTASGLLPTFLYSYLHVNNEQNALVVSAPSQMLDKIQKDLGKVDIAPPQIMIEAMVIESSSVDDLSLSLGLVRKNASLVGTMDTASGEATYTTVGELPVDFQARVKALVGDHKAKVDARPSMSVVNGQQADIFIGAQRFIRVQYPSGTGLVNEYIQSVDVGTRITVTPWTGSNGEITMNISPEVSNVVELESATGLPTLSTRRASTTVRVKNGETVIIGGLTQRQDYITTRKFPVLGEIPLVGHFFKSKNRSTTDTDLVMLITPRILTIDGHSQNPAQESKLSERVLAR